jgi:FixJ family two-component response regulator
MRIHKGIVCTDERPLRTTVYIVAPAAIERDHFSQAIGGDDVDVLSFDCPAELLRALDAEACGCIVAPVDLPGRGLRWLIAEIRRRHVCFTVVAIGRDDDMRVAVEAARAGAAGFVEPPISPQRLRSAVRRAIAAARVAHAHSRKP